MFANFLSKWFGKKPTKTEYTIRLTDSPSLEGESFSAASFDDARMKVALMAAKSGKVMFGETVQRDDGTVDVTVKEVGDAPNI